MEDILKDLKDKPQETVNRLMAAEVDPKKLESLRKEHDEFDRDMRETQIGQVQKDKTIKGKKVTAVRIPIPMQNKIVKTATAFEVGEPVTLIPDVTGKEDNENKVTQEIERLWKINRLDNLIQKAITLQKSELQCAVLFYIEDLKPENWFNKLVGVNEKKDIKARLLKNKSGRMAPMWDAFGNMTAFTWSFDTKEEGKSIKNVWVYTDTKLIKLKGSPLVVESIEDHGFSKIPVVFFSQEKPEWALAEKMIDRLEVAMSKLGASNDYSGHPILMLYGEVIGGPDKDEDGKAMRFKMIEDEDSGKVKHGDAKFLTHDNAPDSVKLELDRLEKYIYSMTSTPDISFENLKNIGDISGIAIKLMFLDAILKAKMNEGDNRTLIERIINVMISGIVTTTGTNLKNEAKNTFFDVQFNSILPDDLKDSIDIYARGVEAGIISPEAAVDGLDMTNDAKRELENIRAAKVLKAPEPDPNPKPNPQEV